jgi:hypothetical protein
MFFLELIDAISGLISAITELINVLIQLGFFKKIAELQFI